MVKLVIPGVLPGLNEYIEENRKNRYLGAKMKRQSEHTVMLAAKKCLRGVRFQGQVMMRYTWIEPNRRRDKDNIAFAKKFVQDALVKAGILRNDGWGEIKGFTDDFDIDKKNPRVEVEIYENTSVDAGGRKKAGGGGTEFESPGGGGGPA